VKKEGRPGDRYVLRQGRTNRVKKHGRQNTRRTVGNIVKMTSGKKGFKAKMRRQDPGSIIPGRTGQGNGAEAGTRQEGVLSLRHSTIKVSDRQKGREARNNQKGQYLGGTVLFYKEERK
jgi:hypothetical protein